MSLGSNMHKVQQILGRSLLIVLWKMYAVVASVLSHLLCLKRTDGIWWRSLERLSSFLADDIFTMLVGHTKRITTAISYELKKIPERNGVT